MTSGVFHSISLSDIVCERDDRQRRELTKIPELADSINRLGLINPLVVTRDLSLVAGERRLEACRSLGWSHVSCQYLDELDPRMLRAIELEENIKRVDLPWQDQCRAIAEYHSLWMDTEGPEWTQKKTAFKIGLSEGHVSNSLNVFKDLNRGDAEIIKADKISSAIRIQGTREQRKSAAASEAIYNKAEADGFNILNEDFLLWAPAYIGPRFNFIHCDFPYGIGSDKFNQGSAHVHGGFDDTFDHYAALCDCLKYNTSRLVADSAHIMFWFSMDYYYWTFNALIAAGWTVHNHPLIWHKNDNSGILPDPMRGPRRVYETAFFGHRGNRPIITPVSNLFGAPLVSGVHMSEKNEEMLKYFFRMIVDENTVMLDPTCGSGSALRAAKGRAKAALGLEINKDFYNGALAALRRHG